MPEIAEIARIVHYLRQHLKGRRIAKVLAQDDANVYGKVGTSAAEFQKALTGRTVLDAKQQGKYFYLVMDKPPHPLMHFGMTGWIKLTNVETGYYRSKEDEKEKKSGKVKGSEDDKDVPAAVYNNAGSTAEVEQEWPPKYYKFVLQMEGEPKVEAAFVDSRRFARIRLVDVPADQMRNTTPLKENGPDPVIDKDILTEQWLTTKLRSKRAPVKAVLLDQANISGIGNWVGDEILHNARIHPEQYSNTLSNEQYKQLHKSLMFVCTTACDLLGDSDQYPADWLFKYRWNKGKKDVNVMPNGEKITHVTVGGRTSAIVPSMQKKTGPVAGEADGVEGEDDDDAEGPRKKSKGKGQKPKAENVETDGKNSIKKASSKISKAKQDEEEDVEPAEAPTSGRKRKAKSAVADDEKEAAPAKKPKANGVAAGAGKRRSTRTSQ